MRFAAGVLIAMVALFAGIFFYPYQQTGAEPPIRREVSVAEGGSFNCAVVHITDGDTFRCAETDAAGKQIRIRLSGVAAREKDGTCADGHPCPAASAEAATTAITRLALGRDLQCRQVGSTYGRIAAFCQLPSGADLSCSMVETGTVVRWEAYWKEGPSC